MDIYSYIYKRSSLAPSSRDPFTAPEASRVVAGALRGCSPSKLLLVPSSQALALLAPSAGGPSLAFGSNGTFRGLGTPAFRRRCVASATFSRRCSTIFHVFFMVSLRFSWSSSTWRTSGEPGGTLHRPGFDFKARGKRLGRGLGGTACQAQARSS